MYLEEIINKKIFVHYLNLYNFNNIKLFYKNIITEVPFLEVDENKMLSFNGKKEYIQGTTSEQLQKYLKEKEYSFNEKKITNYMEKQDRKYVSNNFYDKFFKYNEKKSNFYLLDYIN